MKTKIVEVGQSLESGYGNWGKLLIGVFDTELRRQSQALAVSGMPSTTPLLFYIGYDPSSMFLLFDLATREGAMFKHGGLASADLGKHRIHVCPMFEPFLAWLYEQPLVKVMGLDLPDAVNLADAKFAMYGHRRQGALL